MRSPWVRVAAIAALGLSTSLLAVPAHAAASYPLQINGIQIAGPDKPADAADWLAAMRRWRTDTRARIGYDSSNYDRPQLAWAQHNPVQPQMMVHDLDFYDRASGRYTVEKYLADLTRRYGGIDSVLVWPTYPNIGVDDRNTDQMIRDIAGADYSSALLKQHVGIREGCRRVDLVDGRPGAGSALAR